MFNKIIAALFILVLIIHNSPAQDLNFSTPNTITNNLELAKKIIIIDIDFDGDKDIVAASSTTNISNPNVAWYENNNFTFTQKIVSTSLPGTRTVDVADLNEDGMFDIVSVSRDITSLTWFEGDDISSNEWITHTEGTQGTRNHDVQVVDLNGDGQLDMVTAEAIQDNGIDSCIIWYENSPSDPGTFTQHILPVPWHRIIAIYVVDLDQDGDLDIIGCDSGDFGELNEDAIFWLENDGNENFTLRYIAENISHPTDIFAGDIDQDGDYDLAVVTWGTPDPPGEYHDVFWYENDGLPASSPSKVWTRFDVAEDFYTPRFVKLVDIDGDIDLDILAISSDENGFGSGGYVTYFVNDGSPLNGGWVRIDLIDDFDYAYHAAADDMDDDGDLDIIASAQDAGDILWWENLVSDDIPNITTSVDYVLWNDKVHVNFSSGPAGTEYLKAFYNAGEVPDKLLTEIGIDHVASNGFYTLKSDESNYTMRLKFSYSGIPEWSSTPVEEDLVMCYWSGTQWEIAPDQTINTSTDSIIVQNFIRSDNNAVLWTLGSTTADNPLPVELVSFIAAPSEGSISLEWETAGEINNLGYELWRTDAFTNSFELIADYTMFEELQGQGSSSAHTLYFYADRTVIPGITYTYRLYQVDINGSSHYLAETRAAIENENLIPDQLVLNQNYPNPFNPQTTISFGVPESKNSNYGDINIYIYDLLGRVVKQFHIGQLLPGYHSVTWDGANQGGQKVSSGHYIMLLTDGQTKVSKKMILAR